MNDRSGWAIRLHPSALLAAGAVRLRGGIEACEAAGLVWLRGQELSDELAYELRKLAADGLLDVAADATLTRPATILPEGKLPEADWQPLDHLLAPAPQPAALGGELPGRVALRLERADQESPATLLLMTIESWTAYATGAPAVRLAPLMMASCADGRVVVRGTPLPPVRGTRFTLNEGIAIPCGLRVMPPIDAAVLKELLGLADGDIALFHPDGSYQRIDAASFARATRGGARQTLAEGRR
ncbi:MAG TPA: hypothetical protein VGI81_16850 [Tepidisphaeraceae bacterium]